MKNLIPFFILLLVTSSCTTENDFLDTIRYFETDKEIYSVNDIFKLTVIISPTKDEEKIIRFNKNLSNLNVSFKPDEVEFGFHQELRKRFIEGPSLFNDKKYIDKYVITKNKPYEKAFNGTISEFNGKIIFEIPELNISDSLDKPHLAKHPTIIINGYCSSVYSASENLFISKEIKISIE